MTARPGVIEVPRTSEVLTALVLGADDVPVVGAAMEPDVEAAVFRCSDGVELPALAALVAEAPFVELLEGETETDG